LATLIQSHFSILALRQQNRDVEMARSRIFQAWTAHSP